LPRRLAIGLALVLIALGAGLSYLALKGDGGGEQPLALATQAPTAAPPEPTPQQDDPRLMALKIERLVVPKAKIDAPVVILGVFADGTMQSPGTPTDAGWYTFSAKPGQIGNMVLSGHVDYINYGAAVFYNLRDVVVGDEIMLRLEDGTTLSYGVEAVTEYEEATAPVAEIVGPTPYQSITLITCAGVFNTSLREYNHRLVIRGARILG
jgi:LPXTG-site transpeptidase (sortase) family protein